MSDTDRGTTTRPLPQFPEPDTAPFWRATKDRRLTYQVCRDCDGIVFHPRRHCPHCGGLDLDWRDSAGHGTVYTFTVIRKNGHPSFRSRTPYIVGFVDLDEGFRMLAELVGVDPEDAAVGQRVTVDWEEHDEVSVPLFRPAGNP